MQGRFGARLGVTVMPEYFQTEGIDAVLDRLQGRLTANAVTTSPYAATPSTPGAGFREPPEDAGQGKARLLDRPLWGRSELWMETAPSFSPTADYYRESLYQPDPATDLTREAGHMVGDFLSAARERNMTTYLQVMAAIPPGYRVQFGQPRDEDQPLLPNGKPVPDRVDRNSSLAAGNTRAYMDGLIRDLCMAYPQCDGLKFDWPEYPPYHFLSLLADYNPQVAPYADEIGIDLARLRHAMANECPSQVVREGIMADAGPREIMDRLNTANAALADHFRLRRHLVQSYVRFLADRVRTHSNGRMKVFVQGFPPPWNLLSGFDPEMLAPLVDELAIKFYTMHWPMMGKNYHRFAPSMVGLPAAQLVGYVGRHFFDIAAADGEDVPLDYPDPTSDHMVSEAAIARKVAVFGHPGVVGISHGYGPVADVVRRFEAVRRATDGRVEINRYAYLDDEKIDALAGHIGNLMR